MLVSGIPVERFCNIEVRFYSKAYCVFEVLALSSRKRNFNLHFDELHQTLCLRDMFGMPSG